MTYDEKIEALRDCCEALVMLTGCILDHVEETPEGFICRLEFNKDGMTALLKGMSLCESLQQELGE